MQAETLFNPTNIISVGVATLAVNVATNTLYAVFKLPPKATAFVASLVIAYVVVAMVKTPEWYEWVLAFFNACLLFCSALGLNELGAKAATLPGKGVGTPKPIVRSWF